MFFVAIDGSGTDLQVIDGVFGELGATSKRIAPATWILSARNRMASGVFDALHAKVAAGDHLVVIDVLHAQDVLHTPGHPAIELLQMMMP